MFAVFFICASLVVIPLHPLKQVNFIPERNRSQGLGLQ